MNKNMKKFLTGSVTAALVATAVAPAASAAFQDVPSNDVHKENIDKAVEKGLIKGFADGTFGPYKDITRGQVAKIIARYLEQNGEVDTTGTEQFTDVNASKDAELAKAALIVRQAEVFTGSNGNLNPGKNITRQEMASVLVRLFGLEDLAEKESVVTDNDKAWDVHVANINILSENEVTNVTEFNPLGNVKRGQFASFMMRALIEPAEVAPEVEGVNAVNPTTVTVEGTGLQNLAKENFSIEGNTIASFEANEEGTEATITFGEKVASGAEQTLVLTQEVEGEEVVTEFDFTYTLTFDEVEVADVVVDNNTTGQTVTFTINGEKADLDYLKEAGYTVEFQSTRSIFAAVQETGAGYSMTSATGQIAKLLDKTNEDGYGYKVVIKDKDGKEVAASALAKVVVKDLDAEFASIDSYEIAAGDLTLENSTTALVGEDVVISNVEGTTASGTKEASIANFTVESSNPAVAYVNADKKIKTLKAGTTEITIKSGETKTSFTLTVSADEARVATEATVDPTSTKLVTESNETVEVEVADQFGEEFTGEVFVKLPTVKVNETDVNVVNFVGEGATNDVTITDGVGEFKVAGANAGEGNITVFDKKDGTELAAVEVSVSDDLDVATREFEIVGGESNDLTIDAYAAGSGEDIEPDTTISLALNQYNADDFFVGKETIAKSAQTAGAYTVQVNTETDADVTVANNEVVVTAGTEAGTVEIVISNGATVLAKETVTVKNSTPVIDNVEFKTVETITKAATAVNAATVLTFDTETGLVSGVDVSTDEKVYFDASSLKLYVEKNGVAGFNANTTDLVVGSLTWVADSGLNVTADTLYTTNLEDKGNVIFTVKDAKNATVDTTSVKVDVPAEEE